MGNSKSSSSSAPSQTTYEFKRENGKDVMVAPQLKETGAGRFIGSTVASVAATVNNVGGSNEYARGAAQAMAAKVGGRVGSAIERGAGYTFYAEERLYADTYNREVAQGASSADAKWWADKMKPSDT